MHQLQGQVMMAAGGASAEAEAEPGTSATAIPLAGPAAAHMVAAGHASGTAHKLACGDVFRCVQVQVCVCVCVSVLK